MGLRVCGLCLVPVACVVWNDCCTLFVVGAGLGGIDCCVCSVLFALLVDCGLRLDIADSLVICFV